MILRSFAMTYGSTRWPAAGTALLAVIALASLSWVATIALAPLLHGSGHNAADIRFPPALLRSLEHVHHYQEATHKDLQRAASSDNLQLSSSKPSRKLLGMSSSKPSRKLLGMSDREKKAMLRGLEDALLEPPRAGKDRRRVTRYLPELLGDETLDQYERRVFIDVGGGDEVEGWFERHYPTGSRRFDIIRLEMEEGGGEDEGDEEMMTRWLRGNVGEGDYVVMKAEAEVVEGMVRSGAISLVDELFLECKHLWEKGGRGKKGRRAYWECISLFGRLRDEGVAVHQWWG